MIPLSNRRRARLLFLSFAVVLTQAVAGFATCNELKFDGWISIGNGANLHADSIQANASKGGYPEFGSPSDPPRFFLEKRFSGGVFDVEWEEQECAGKEAAWFEDIRSGSIGYRISDSGSVECDPTKLGSRKVLWKVNWDPVTVVEDWEVDLSCSSPLPWFPIAGDYWTVTESPMRREGAATDICFGSAHGWGSGTGSHIETLNDEYTTTRLIGVAAGQLPPFAGFGNPKTEAGQGHLASSSRNLSADERSYSLRRAKYKWEFEPHPSGTTTLIWIERFFPDDPEKEHQDAGMTYVYEGEGPGPVDSPVYNLSEPEKNGIKQIIDNAFSATFELCPPGEYELVFTYRDIDDTLTESDPEIVHVSDVSKPVIFVRERPESNVYSSLFQTPVKAVATFVHPATMTAAAPPA